MTLGKRFHLCQDGSQVLGRALRRRARAARSKCRAEKDTGGPLLEYHFCSGGIRFTGPVESQQSTKSTKRLLT